MKEDVFKNIEFIASASAASKLPPDSGREFAFWGRSNVGKSSLLNALAHGRKIARASNTPGRTRLLNFFSLGKNARLVDMPGYGFAKMPLSARRKLEELVCEYLVSRKSLARLFLLIDSRCGVIKTDTTALEFLNSAGIRFQIVLTKSDKISTKELAAREAEILLSLKSYPAALGTLISTSAKTGEGLNRLRQAGLKPDTRG
jgi:GTP-binding protein